MLSEISQTEKGKYRLVSLKSELIDTEMRLVAATVQERGTVTGQIGE